MSKASVKISKNNHHLHHRHHHHHHHQFNSLKPRVYITHSSTFKTLVQELTGNNGTPEPSTPSTTAPPPPPPTGIHGLQIKHKDQHLHTNQHNNIQDYVPVFDDSTWSTPFDQTNSLSEELLDMQQSKSGYQIETNMESWLLEVEPFS